MHHRVPCKPDLDPSHTNISVDYFKLVRSYTFNNIRGGSIDATNIVKPA